MKTLKNITIAIFAIFTLTACGGESPESVAEKYCKAAISADINTAKKYATADQAEELAEIFSNNEAREFILNVYRDAKLKLASSNIAEDGESAEVIFDTEMVDDGEKENVKLKVSLIKEGSSWKVKTFR